MKKLIVIMFVLGIFTCSTKENKSVNKPQSTGKEVEVQKDRHDEIKGKFKASLPAEFNYLLTLPKEYKETGEPSPMIVFLHGGGERGENYELLKRHGPPMMVKNGEDFPFVVLSPQCPRGHRWTHLLIQVKELIDNLVAEHNIDKNRIYLTGMSLGGYGTWNLAMTYPSFFAAIAPMACNGGMKDEASRIIDMPIWAFQGEKDGFELQQEMIDKVKRDSKTDVRYTMYPETDHEGTWVKAYKTPELYEWFLSHKRKARLDIEAVAEESNEKCDFIGKWEVQMLKSENADTKWEINIVEKNNKISVNSMGMEMPAKQENCKLSFNLAIPPELYDKTDVFFTIHNGKLYGIMPTPEGDMDVVGLKIE